MFFIFFSWFILLYSLPLYNNLISLSISIKFNLINGYFFSVLSVYILRYIFKIYTMVLCILLGFILFKVIAVLNIHVALYISNVASNCCTVFHDSHPPHFTTCLVMDTHHSFLLSAIAVKSHLTVYWLETRTSYCFSWACGLAI